MREIKIKLLNPDAKLPIRFNETDACYDVYATSKSYIGDNRYEYGLGFSLELPENTQLDLRPRSSIYKTGLVLSNSIGTGDEDYRGEYRAIFYHVITSLPPYEIGDRILQIQLRSREDVQFILSDELNDTVRGAGGFGHTGK
jgi:dUTP pyrophosphatase